MSIGSIVSFVAGKLGELLVQEVKLLYGMEDQVRSLQRELGMMNAFLIDVESRDEEGGDARSHTTLAEIRKIAYDVEDVIESYIFEVNPSTNNKAEDFLKRMYLPVSTQSHHLRSLVYQAGYEINYYQGLTLKDICQNFRLLRVLILEDIKTSDGSLPTGIGSLIHVRYLGLIGTNISELPSSIGNLRNLVTLTVLSTEIEVRIPNGLWKIEGLRHLHFPGSAFIEGTVKLHALKQLQTLWGIGGGSWMLEELPRLSPTAQKLYIQYIESKEQLEAAFRCPSIMSDSLHSLRLEWELGVMLENLQPIMHCQHLRKLFLRGRIKDRLSSCNQFPASIIKLELWGTGFEEEADVAALGKLPNLMSLVLEKKAYVGGKWTWIAGQFSKLKELKLYQLHNWEEWSIETGAMPQLTKLEIGLCLKLRRLPEEGLKLITTLQDLCIRGGSELNYVIEQEQG